jgi:hypothetical protein
MKNFLLIAAAAAALAPFASQAESNFVTVANGSTTPPAVAKLNFKIVVPKVLFLQVGAGSSMATLGTVNTVEFNVPGASIGSGPVGGVAGTGGDLANGGVTVRVLGNSGDVSLSNKTLGRLINTGVSGAPTVPWTDIIVTPGPLATTTTDYDNVTPLPHPPFNNTDLIGGTSATATLLTASGGLVRREGSWTFAYANTKVLPAGTYGDVTGNGEVTYTATAP